MSSLLPLLLEVDQLDRHIKRSDTGLLPDRDLLIVDLSSEESYRQAHIPGAVHVKPAELISGEKPAPGQLPSLEKINHLFSRLGLTPDTHVVCYDDEGGPWAGRFIWTLDLIGHKNSSFLNGGIQAWQAAGHPMKTKKILAEQTRNATQTNYTFDQSNQTVLASTKDILDALDHNEKLLVWDARSPEEYSGEKNLAQRGGHIPGAINCNWLNLLGNDKKLRPDLQSYLNRQGITADKHVVTHCQTHRRSGLTYISMKILGYPHIRAYPGSWSEWGNRTDTPIENSIK